MEILCLAASALCTLLVIVIAIAFIKLHKNISSLNDIFLKSRYEDAGKNEMHFNLQKQKIDDLNRQLTEAMSRIDRNMGQVNNINDGINDIRRLMTNVKTRGISGELQLRAILEDVLAPEQYDMNVPVKKDSERVEFAVKFPSADGDCMYLPIDSKFPGDVYLNLLEAYDTGEPELVKKATEMLKNAIIKAARDINTKYIYPPMTTEFGIMFLPYEGLYAETLRLNIMESLQSKFRVCVAGPTTMAAMLSSFRLGFRSIALQHGSAEVWNTLAQVKTEFEKFDSVLEKSQSRLEQTQKELETLVGVRTRAIKKILDKTDELSNSAITPSVKGRDRG